MTSTERSWKRRVKIHVIKVILKELLAKGAERKKTAYLENSKMRSEPTEMQEELRQKEREKKRQLASRKSNQTKSQLNTPQKKLLKNATCSVQRKKRTGTSNIEIWFKLLQKGQSIVNIIVTFQFTKL